MIYAFIYVHVYTHTHLYSYVRLFIYVAYTPAAMVLMPQLWEPLQVFPLAVTCAHCLAQEPWYMLGCCLLKTKRPCKNYDNQIAWCLLLLLFLSSGGGGVSSPASAACVLWGTGLPVLVAVRIIWSVVPEGAEEGVLAPFWAGLGITRSIQTCWALRWSLKPVQSAAVPWVYK